MTGILSPYGSHCNEIRSVMSKNEIIRFLFQVLQCFLLSNNSLHCAFRAALYRLQKDVDCLMSTGPPMSEGYSSSSSHFSAVHGYH